MSLADIVDPDRAATDNIPRAYLNILFFDERFNFVPENSTAVRVAQSGDGAAPLVLANVKAPKNGYVYIYVSNENDQSVYYDNLQVVHNRGRIIEEDHYYAFGLKIAGISSNKLGNDNYEGYLQNKNLYNDKELIDEADLDWYDYGFRNYDAQIGRFPQLDPLTWDYPELTNYQYAGNDPIANVDVDGLEPWNILQPVVVTGHRTVQAANTGLTAAKVGAFALKTANVAYNSLVGVARTFNTYVNPLSPLVEIATGKSVESDFNIEKSRVVSGAESAMMFLPIGKIAGTVAKTAERVGFETLAKVETSFAEGTFSVFNWKGYPAGGVKPTGPFRLLEGEEYTTARNLASKTNAALHKANPRLKGLQIHEIHPVKFGGNPTNMANKISLTPTQHAEYTNFWNSLMRNLK